MKHFIENCPMRQCVRRLCVGAGAKAFNEWDSSLIQGNPPPDIIVHVEWNINGNTFKLFKYQQGLNAMLITKTSGNYMLFNEDIRKDFTLVQYFEDEYNRLISYALES